MIYQNIHEGVFKARPNRFIAEVLVDGQIERCHVKNTGRCSEILLPDTKVYVSQSDSPNRSTKYDLVVAYKGGCLINIDSQAPNKVFREYLEMGRFIEGSTLIKPEYKHSGSRFDFYVETGNHAETGSRKVLIEVKGVTLEHSGVAMFPDAPTQRGVKHLRHLIQATKEGFEAYVVFVVQMNGEGIEYFTPNYAMHQEFGDVLAEAQCAGINIAAFDCMVTPGSLTINNLIDVRL